MTTMMSATRNALDDLQWHWGSAYLITGAAGHWLAHRRDNGRMIVADSPDGLRWAILADYAAQPVSRDVPPDAAS